MRKVPRILAIFWFTKLLSTALGESTSDFLVHSISPVVAVALGFLGLAVALVAQFAVRRYIAWVYWLAVLMVAIFGTMAADVVHIQFGVPYVASTVTFGLMLVVVFILWQRVEGTLSIHSICTPRREAFYWATVVTTFALGTAAGDMTASTMHLGYLVSGLLFGALIAVPAFAWRFLALNPIVAFWFAYVITRPIGATFADWTGKSTLGGLGFGDGLVSGVLALVILGCVSYLAVTKVDLEVDTMGE